jgi:hypothetical protein
VLTRLATTLAFAAVVLALAPAAFASGGNYTIVGGTTHEQAQVHSALDASAFPWGIVPGQVAIHIVKCGSSYASPGEIWLDARMLDAGRFSWGVVQHEYAHQVDFSVLDDSIRAQLATLLRGDSWAPPSMTEGHAQADAERFADLVSWAYWQSSDNIMKPAGASDEGGNVDPVAFRSALASLLPQVAVRVTSGSHGRHP